MSEHNDAGGDCGNVACQRKSGNAATMREALEKIREIVEIANIAYLALAKPPRNCDRFNTVKDAAIAFARERQDAPQPCPDFTFSAWLFAPATEQKGETDAK